MSAAIGCSAPPSSPDGGEPSHDARDADERAPRDEAAPVDAIDAHTERDGATSIRVPDAGPSGDAADAGVPDVSQETLDASMAPPDAPAREDASRGDVPALPDVMSLVDAGPRPPAVTPRRWDDRICQPLAAPPCTAGANIIVLDAAAIVGDHATAINAALATTTATQVCLRSGTYRISTPIVVRRNGVTLRGEGEGTVLQLAAGAYPTASMPDACSQPAWRRGEPTAGSARLPLFDCVYEEDPSEEKRTRVGIVTLRADNVRVEHMTLDQNYRALGLSSDEVLVGGAHLPVLPRASSLALAVNADLDRSGTRDGAARSRMSGARVSNVTFIDHFGDAIGMFAATGDDVEVTNCRFASAYTVACDPRYASLRAGTGVSCWSDVHEAGEQSIAVRDTNGFVATNNCIDGATDDAIAHHRGTNARIENNLIWTTGGRILLEGVTAPTDASRPCTSEGDCANIVRNNYVEYIESGGGAIQLTIVDQGVRPTPSASVLVQGNQLLFPPVSRYHGVPITVEYGVFLNGTGDNVQLLGNRVHYAAQSHTFDCGSGSTAERCGHDFDAFLLASRKTNSGLVFAAGRVEAVRNVVTRDSADPSAFVYGLREASLGAAGVGAAGEQWSSDDPFGACNVTVRDNSFEANVGVRLHLGASTSGLSNRTVSGVACPTCSALVESTGLEVASTGMCQRLDVYGQATRVGCPFVTGGSCPVDGVPQNVAPSGAACVALSPAATALTGGAPVAIAPFRFYGVERTSAWVSPERGVLGFANLGAVPVGSRLPRSTFDVPLIAPFWSQRPLVGAQVRTEVVTTPAGSVRVFEWSNAQVYVGDTSTLTPPLRFQVHLRADHTAAMHYCTSPATPTAVADAMTGAHATIGFQRGATVGQELGYRLRDTALPTQSYVLYPTE